MSYGEYERERLDQEYLLFMLNANRQVERHEWTTKDGQKLLVEDMDTSHIANCIRMLQKQIDRDDEEDDIEFKMDDAIYSIKKAWIKVFRNELNERARRMNG